MVGTAGRLPDLRGYVELALRSGLPEAALAQSNEARRRWLESYADQLVTRDAAQVAPRRDPARLRRYVEAYALNSAGVVEERTLYEAAAVDHRTSIAYERLFQDLLIVEPVPAWTSNRLKRLTRSPKRYLVDPALMAAVLRLDATGILRDGDLLGRLLDTFVLAQVRAQLPISGTRARVYHLRERQGRHEIDLLGELAGHEVIAVEIKADAAPDYTAGRHLSWLRDGLGSRFVAGVILHTGPRVFEMGERIIAAPISTLWA